MGYDELDFCEEESEDMNEKVKQLFSAAANIGDRLLSYEAPKMAQASSYMQEEKMALPQIPQPSAEISGSQVKKGQRIMIDGKEVTV